MNPIQTAQLRKIAAAHDNLADNPDFSKFALVKPKSVAALVKLGYVAVNEAIPANENGEHPARATQAGIDFIMAAPATSSAALVKPTFAIANIGEQWPEAKRGNPGNGGRSLYPFDQLQPGQAFFVPANEGETDKDVAKRMASVVSAANKRYIVASRAKTGENGQPILSRGKPAMEHQYSKHFSVRPFADGALLGAPGKAGAGVRCDPVATGA
jgi:hypothetical protein